jgi:membrane associated rhomboid family serine protease
MPHRIRRRAIMFLPIGDHPNPRSFPYVTAALIAVNVVIYVFLSLPMSFEPANAADPRLREYVGIIARSLPPGVSPASVIGQVTDYDLFTFQWGFRPDAMKVSDLFASMFLHGGFMHLFGNMLFLWIYGNNVEHRLGGLWYLVAYLVCGVAAALFQAVFNLTSGIPMIGASGAISGVLGFYLWWFPHNKIKVFLFLFPFYAGTVLIPAVFVLVMYLVVDNLLPFFFASTEGGGVAHGAHIGGFLAGLAIAMLMGRRPKQEEVEPRFGA